MKRAAELVEAGTTFKRSKASTSSAGSNWSDPFDPTLEQKASDLCKRGAPDGVGYISGTVFMIWSITQKARFNVETVENLRKYRFDIELSGACSRYFGQLQLHQQDVFQIALKGVFVERMKDSSSPDSLPMVLKYRHGVIIKFIQRKRKPSENGLVVDTWLRDSDVARLSEDEWFSTPINQPRDPFVSPKDDNGGTINAQPNDTPITKEPPPVVPLTKKQAKKLRKKQRALEAVRGMPTLAIAESIENNRGNARKLIASDREEPPPHREGIHPVSSDKTTTAITPAMIPSTPLPTAIVTSSRTENRDPALEIEAGFYDQNGNKYSPLGSITAAGTFFNVVGLVRSISSPKKTKSDDWSLSMTLIDPSNYDGTSEHGFTINCFTSTYKQWLPSAKDGDVLILRCVKAVMWGDKITGVGYRDKLQWAVFDPKTGQAHHGNIGNAPRSEGLAEGHGYPFSPFWNATEDELAYCSKLAGWESAMLKLKQQQQQTGEIHPVPDNFPTRGVRRVHRLISDASPDMPPSGYFDCTVEVLYGHQYDCSTYSLYVTDYTSNPQTSPVQAKWCHPGLADRVLRIEMWPPANELAKTMLAGEYWSICNNRMKIDRAGFLEGTFSASHKARKLDESEAEFFPHLKGLLQRKKDWESSSAQTSPQFKHLLFEDVKTDIFFNCTVEILHVSLNRRGFTHLYVTDYTASPNLPSAPNEPWSRGLEGRVAKISLWDGQVNMATSIEPFSFYSILKLRMKTNTTSRYFDGRLGGEERLIHKLKSSSVANEHLAALIRRKEEWKKRMKHVAAHRPVDESVNNIALLTSLNRNDYTTIREIQECQDRSNHFRILARVVDFYPLRLQTCVGCSRCQKDIDMANRGCLTCKDVGHYTCKLFFWLEDEVGDRLRVSVSNPESTILRGLKLIDLPAALRELSERLKPIIGNLKEVHQGISDNEVILPDTPLLEFTIEKSWMVPTDGDWAYRLMDHRIIIAE